MMMLYLIDAYMHHSASMGSFKVIIVTLTTQRKRHSCATINETIYQQSQLNEQKSSSSLHLSKYKGPKY